RGTYGGDQVQRDGAYHQGPVWSWLMGAYVVAHYRVYQDREAALALLQPFEDHLRDAGLGSISEILEGNPPHLPRGCIAQAWSVREDYSATGEAWTYFPHDHARSRAYRWNEDGLGGLCDDQQRLCFALALWNGQDPILKERLFGLAGPEGNHGEDVKEYYYYLDSTPTHSYMRALYKYPQKAFPYGELVEENRRRGKDQPEYELVDTGIFAEDR